MRYFRGGWSETRGDAFDSWGRSTSWFALEGDRAHLQLEVYENGPALLYDEQHTEDPYGMLAEDVSVDALDEVAKDAFDQALAQNPPANRVPVPLRRWGLIAAPPRDSGSYVMIEVESGDGWKKPPPSDAVRIWVRNPDAPDDADENRTTWLHASDVSNYMRDWSLQVTEWLPEGAEP